MPQDEELEVMDSIKLAKDLLSIDEDAKEVFSVQTGLYRKYRKRYFDDETGEERVEEIEVPVVVKEFFDDYRKGFLDRKEYRKVLDVLARGDKYKIMLSRLDGGKNFIPYIHLKQALTILTLSGSKNGAFIKTILTKFIGEYEEKKGGLFK